MAGWEKLKEMATAGRDKPLKDKELERIRKMADSLVLEVTVRGETITVPIPSALAGERLDEINADESLSPTRRLGEMKATLDLDARIRDARSQGGRLDVPPRNSGAWKRLVDEALADIPLPQLVHWSSALSALSESIAADAEKKRAAIEEETERLLKDLGQLRASSTNGPASPGNVLRDGEA